MKNKPKNKLFALTLILWITFFLLLLLPSITLAYGGSSYSAPTPTTESGSLIINNGAQTTTLNAVTLALSANNVTYMAISNTADFLNVSWEAYSAAKQWTLTIGEGEKTVYVKFKNSQGTESNVISKSITLKSSTLVNQPDLNNDSKVNDFDFSILMSNWGTPKSKEADLNNDGKVNDYDFSILISKWTK